MSSAGPLPILTRTFRARQPCVRRNHSVSIKRTRARTQIKSRRYERSRQSGDIGGDIFDGLFIGQERSCHQAHRPAVCVFLVDTPQA